MPVPRAEIPSLLCAVHQGSPDPRAGGTDSTPWWLSSRCLQGGEKLMGATFENIYSIQHSSQPVPCLPYFVPLATSHLNLIHHLPRLLSFSWIHEVLRSHVSLYMFFSLRMPSPTFLHNQNYSFLWAQSDSQVPRDASPTPVRVCCPLWGPRALGAGSLLGSFLTDFCFCC